MRVAIARSKPLLDLLGVGYVTGPAGWTGTLESAGLVPLQRATDAGEATWT